jgi:site-specific recombinase XerD
MRHAGFRSCPLGKDRAYAIAYVDKQNAEWDEIRRGLEPLPVSIFATGTLGRLVEDLRKTSEYGDKAPATIDELEYALVSILKVFGPSRLKSITPTRCEKFYDALRAQGSLHRAAKIMKWFRYVMNRARKLGLIELNPTEVVTIRQPKARQATWEEEQVYDAIKIAWRQRQYGTAAAIAIMYDTSLRPGDVRMLPPEAFSEDRVTLVTAKTGTHAELPLSSETAKLVTRYKAKLGAIPMPGQPLLRTPRGRPFTKNSLAKKARDAMRRAGIPDEVQLRDLRRTASKERAEAGATAAELAASTTHSIARGSAILDVYNPPSYAMAKAAHDKRRAHRENKK